MYSHINSPRYQTSLAKRSMAAEGMQTMRTRRSARLRLANKKLIRDLTRFAAPTTMTTERLAMTPAMKIKEYMTLAKMMIYRGGSGMVTWCEMFTAEKL